MLYFPKAVHFMSLLKESKSAIAEEMVLSNLDLI